MGDDRAAHPLTQRTESLYACNLIPHKLGSGFAALIYNAPRTQCRDYSEGGGHSLAAAHLVLIHEHGDGETAFSNRRNRFLK